MHANYTSPGTTPPRLCDYVTGAHSYASVPSRATGSVTAAAGLPASYPIHKLHVLYYKMRGWSSPLLWLQNPVPVLSSRSVNWEDSIPDVSSGVDHIHALSTTLQTYQAHVTISDVKSLLFLHENTPSVMFRSCLGNSLNSICSSQELTMLILNLTSNVLRWWDFQDCSSELLHSNSLQSSNIFYLLVPANV